MVMLREAREGVAEEGCAGWPVVVLVSAERKLEHGE